MQSNSSYDRVSQFFSPVYACYHTGCKAIERPLRSKIPEIPKNSIKQILPSFLCSFTVSTLLSGGNIIAGLAGGALAILAHVIHDLIIIGTEKLSLFLIKRSHTTPTKDFKAYPVHHEYMYLLGSGLAICIGRGLGMAVNLKASFLLTAAFLIWDVVAPHFLKPQTPLTGIVVAFA